MRSARPIPTGESVMIRRARLGFSLCCWPRRARARLWSRAMPDGASDRLEFPDGSAIVRWTADGLLSFGVHRDLVQTVPVLVDDCGVDALLSGLANEEPAYVWPAWYAAFDDTAPESLQPVV